MSTTRMIFAVRLGRLHPGDALVYLHDTEDRQRAIAAAVSDLGRQELRRLDASPDRDTAQGSGT